MVCRSSKLLAAGTTAKTKVPAGRRIAGAENDCSHSRLERSWRSMPLSS
jgi:hypothetical protein